MTAQTMPVARRLVSRTGGYARQAGRDLWHALATGPDEPPPAVRRLRRAGVFPMVTLLLFALPLGWFLVSVGRQMSLRMGGPWWPLVMVLTGLLLVLAARRPLLAWRVACLALLYEMAMALWEPAGYPVFPPLFISELQPLAFATVLLLVAASQPLGVIRWVWALTAALVWLVPLNWGFELADAARRFAPFASWEPLFPIDTLGVRLVGPPELQSAQVAAVLAVTVVVLIGQWIRYRSRTREQLAVAQEHGLVLAERARIARELHDVVAHHMSMIAVRAETAPYRLREVAPEARGEFEEISRESRTALAEMRRLLGVLRSNSPTTPTAPQPSLTDLADLVESARAAGATVSLEMHGAMSGLPAAVDVCAYRIVQEALANAAQHAPGAPVRIMLRRTDRELELLVRNGPGHRAARPAGDAGPAAAGHGVRGMRERVMMLNGTLYAGLTADGGFEVSATLPLTGDDS